ncbi:MULTISPECIES: hypothetical protein [Cyanophyceae]|uniref:hypothetical protein n=1 Tax=Cyanophyceae TaxID=3028117 RepID=UPI001684F639|nr:hypothetical protein [Trichocoleus sp. FACHB-40]MBD2005422.1 hypothetical protein [Trichocoleus sp. FACHB-40]
MSAGALLRQLYLRLQRLAPGTREYEITDRAISLALNSGRQSRSVEFLFHDVLRNAQHSILRTYARRVVFLKNFTAYSAQALDSINEKTPEANCIASEMEDKIREALAQDGSELINCFDGMLVGESIAETAARCGISRRSVDRARQKIREISRSFFFPQEEA